jgi:hypothetical protein
MSWNAQWIVENFDNFDEVVKGIREVYTWTTIVILVRRRLGNVPHPIKDF